MMHILVVFIVRELLAEEGKDESIDLNLEGVEDTGDDR